MLLCKSTHYRLYGNLNQINTTSHLLYDPEVGDLHQRKQVHLIFKNTVNYFDKWHESWQLLLSLSSHLCVVPVVVVLLGNQQLQTILTCTSDFNPTRLYGDLFSLYSCMCGLRLSECALPFFECGCPETWKNNEPSLSSGMWEEKLRASRVKLSVFNTFWTLRWIHDGKRRLFRESFHLLKTLVVFINTLYCNTSQKLWNKLCFPFCNIAYSLEFSRDFGRKCLIFVWCRIQTVQQLGVFFYWWEVWTAKQCCYNDVQFSDDMQSLPWQRMSVWEYVPISIADTFQMRKLLMQ